jgi:hypothetical protein
LPGRERSPSLIALEQAQDALPGPLRGIPLPALLAGGGLAVIAVLVVVLAAVRSDKAIAALEEDGVPPRGSSSAATPGAPSTASPPAPAQLSAAELEAARVGGADAVAALARRFPNDPGVLQALGVALAHDKKDFAGALRAIRRLLEVAPDTKADKEVQQALVEIANGPSEVAADAFDTMKTKMGSFGPDLVFELAQSATGKYAKEHAGPALDDPALMKAASKALLVADELRRKSACARKPVVRRAATDGDARSLAYLRPLVATKPCGGFLGRLMGGECGGPACITPPDRKEINAAIAAIEKRDPNAAKAAPATSASAPPERPERGGSTLR